MTRAADRKAGLLPPRSPGGEDRHRRRLHGALGDIEHAPRWLLAAYYQDICDLERIAQEALSEVRAAGYDENEERTPLRSKRRST